MKYSGALSAAIIDHLMGDSTVKKTCRSEITRRLEMSAPTPLAVHEFQIQGYSENALATEVSIMARHGLVEGRYRTGKKFKEWGLIKTPASV